MTDEEHGKLIKELNTEHFRQTMNLKKTIEELTVRKKELKDEVLALNAMRHELEETIKAQTKSNNALLSTNKAIVGGVTVILSMIGKAVDT